MSQNLLDRLVASLDAAGDYDSNVAVAPIAILWPDEARQFESALGEFQCRRRVLRLGAYDLAKWQGPVYWLRCLLSGELTADGLPDGTPVVYLPGVSRDALRALDAVSPDLAPLAAVQNRCQWFCHPNGKDWTVRALLSNKERGIGLNVATDGPTTEALVASLLPLLEQPIARLESKHIDAAFLNGLLNPDLVRNLAQLARRPCSGARTALTEGAWSGFVQQCKQDFSFDPAAEGEIEGARLLGEAQGMWAQAWLRFRENPTRLPGYP